MFVYITQRVHIVNMYDFIHTTIILILLKMYLKCFYFYITNIILETNNTFSAFSRDLKVLRYHYTQNG